MAMREQAEQAKNTHEEGLRQLGCVLHAIEDTAMSARKDIGSGDLTRAKDAVERVQQLATVMSNLFQNLSQNGSTDQTNQDMVPPTLAASNSNTTPIPILPLQEGSNTQPIAITSESSTGTTTKTAAGKRRWRPSKVTDPPQKVARLDEHRVPQPLGPIYPHQQEAAAAALGSVFLSNSSSAPSENDMLPAPTISPTSNSIGEYPEMRQLIPTPLTAALSPEHVKEAIAPHFSCELPPELKSMLDGIFFALLGRICSDPAAADKNGNAIHNDKKASKIEPYTNERTPFHTFKLRITPLMQAFEDEVKRLQKFPHPFAERHLRYYLSNQRFIQKYSEKGTRLKSKGNKVWIVEGRKNLEGGWQFRKFERTISHEEDLVAFSGRPFTFTLKLVDPQLGVPNLSEIDSILPDMKHEVEDTVIYRWQIPNWSVLKAQKRTHSPEFLCGGHRWRVLVFPNGNNNDSLAVFLDSVEAANAPKDSSWHVCAQFAITITNPDDETVVKTSVAHHRFTPEAADWGFNHFVKLAQLDIPFESFTRPFIENDKTVLMVHLRVLKDETGVLWHNFVNYDSKKETGFVGLKNQGATCYMNSLLQSLYFTNYFRKATYSIPTENDEPTKSIPLALQRIFYQLQHSSSSVGTIELTKSFGWDSTDSFMQHDVQEFNRVLQDNLESKMKGTKAEGAISKLFVGKYKSYIKCIDVDFESSRVEDFYDIQLNVKGSKTLRDSFIDYVAVETLDGDNKYMAEGHGLQAARKGVIFTQFPPVLHLQLKRFEYDIERDAMVKINDRHEFPSVIDLDDFLSDSADKSIKQRYHLFGVLVHSGDLHGGHYFSFLRSSKDGKWFKFDDDRVIPVTEAEVMEENYGGEHPGLKPGMKPIKRFTNAYMLVYIREADIDVVQAEVVDEDIPDHLRRRFNEEQQALEKEKQDKKEQHLYLNVKVITDQHIPHDGFDLCNFDDKTFPLTDVWQLKMKKEATIIDLKQLITKEFLESDASLEAPYDRLVLWPMITRANRTVRPDLPIAFADLEKTMEYFKETQFKSTSELRFYCDLLPNETLSVINDYTITLFVKFLDPISQKMHYAGKFWLDKDMILADFLPAVVTKCGLPAGTNILVYEVGSTANATSAVILYYELLDVTLEELETKRQLKITFVDHARKEHGPFDIYVLRNAKAGEVINQLTPKLHGEPGGSGRLRLLEVANSRLHKLFDNDESIVTISDVSTVYIEEQPLDELNVTEQEKFVNVFHFNKELLRGHGVPFRISIKKGEPFSYTKERILSRMSPGDRDLQKMKFFIIPGGMGKPKPIDDGDILSDYEFAPNETIGIDHIDKSGKSTRSGVERAIKIFN
ncbi:hypothetical protein HDV05_005793 [Chytridiales sp. JEL 0842]|nr:hypothetical protein HDV05_005793 [Chytridiales sp. JEL 0842]